MRTNGLKYQAELLRVRKELANVTTSNESNEEQVNRLRQEMDNMRRERDGLAASRQQYERQVRADVEKAVERQEALRRQAELLRVRGELANATTSNEEQVNRVSWMECRRWHRKEAAIDKAIDALIGQGPESLSPQRHYGSDQGQHGGQRAVPSATLALLGCMCATRWCNVTASNESNEEQVNRLRQEMDNMRRERDELAASRQQYERQVRQDSRRSLERDYVPPHKRDGYVATRDRMPPGHTEGLPPPNTYFPNKSRPYDRNDKYNSFRDGRVVVND
ncbi:unnamed protein product [Vitrella brassicaformis CCMP3155]|uniref:Uncharacterized protein n=1 Tax=Vitrella brassicaformis (strain CCMP3155) TaxID=1169540 RepID=A0A0G4EIC1_VITBC|nr:unnamed protein product [Vitrella brassicaformis CCMP3155]|eukprot:CEL95627.1 unnamed protein product [Vitrella brassicaformis CCMP3155]